MPFCIDAIHAKRLAEGLDRPEDGPFPALPWLLCGFERVRVIEGQMKTRSLGFGDQRIEPRLQSLPGVGGREYFALSSVE